MLDFVCASYLIPARVGNFLALRSLHSSKPTSSNDAPLFSTNPKEPITNIAERGSTQLSVREPQNKAGVSNPVVVFSLGVVVNACWVRGRVRFVDNGQDRELGSTGFDVANDIRSGVLCRGDDAHGCCQV